MRSSYGHVLRVLGVLSPMGIFLLSLVHARPGFDTFRNYSNFGKFSNQIHEHVVATCRSYHTNSNGERFVSLSNPADIRPAMIEVRSQYMSYMHFVQSSLPCANRYCVVG